MSSISDIKEDLKNLNKKLDKILETLEQSVFVLNEKLEAVAAKIIKELKIQEGPSNQEILEALEQKDLKTSLPKEEEKPKPLGLGRYSYPNYGVGNAELGSSGNPKALTWPFGKTE